MLQFNAYHPSLDYIVYSESDGSYTANPVAALILTGRRKDVTFLYFYN
ncbi:hypothetical protein ACFPMF_26535 [Larkinella bovis]|uniref:Uncharacterized protein n=1 Tax=Larkinella bovis TaxID=683041 RepID=A0ABW0IKN0_9BACT